MTSGLAWALRRLWDNRPDGYLLCVVPRQPTDQPGLAPRRPQAPGGQAEAAGLGDDQVRSLSLVPASSWTQQVTAGLTQEWRNRLLFLMRRGSHLRGEMQGGAGEGHTWERFCSKCMPEAWGRGRRQRKMVLRWRLSPGRELRSVKSWHWVIFNS